MLVDTMVLSIASCGLGLTGGWDLQGQGSVRILRCARSAGTPAALIYAYQSVVSRSFSCAIPHCCGRVFGCPAGVLGCVISDLFI